MRRWEDFSNFFFATKTSNIGAHFAPTINSFDAPGTFDTPDSDFRDLLDELFNLNIKAQNRKKSNLRKLFFGPFSKIEITNFCEKLRQSSFMFFSKIHTEKYVYKKPINQPISNYLRFFL